MIRQKTPVFSWSMNHIYLNFSKPSLSTEKMNISIGIFSINENTQLRCLQKLKALYSALETLFNYHILFTLFTKFSVGWPTEWAKQDYTDSLVFPWSQAILISSEKQVLASASLFGIQCKKFICPDNEGFWLCLWFHKNLLFWSFNSIRMS